MKGIQALWVFSFAVVGLGTSVAAERGAQIDNRSASTHEIAASGVSLMAKAEAGDPVAETAIGGLLEADERFEEAATAYRRAAEQGNAQAQALLGRLYVTGRGVPRDYREAAQWARKAAEQGNVIGQVILAAMNATGTGGLQDDAEAAKWARAAAEQDCETFGASRLSYCGQGQGLLAGLYLEGRGVPQDYVLAHMWAGLAAAALPEGVQQRSAVQLRDRAADHMTIQQIADAQRLARDWKPTRPAERK